MREEVLSQMEVERREATAGTPASAPGHLPAAGLSTGAAVVDPPSTAVGFKFAALGQELVVAGVFVRVYNEQPNFPVADPAAFCKGLVTFIHTHMKPEVTLHQLNSPYLPLILMSCFSTFYSLYNYATSVSHISYVMPHACSGCLMYYLRQQLYH